MAPPMHDELAQVARREGVSLNQHIVNVLDSAVHAEHHDARSVPRWLPAAIVTHITVTLVCVGRGRLAGDLVAVVLRLAFALADIGRLRIAGQH